MENGKYKDDSTIPDSVELLRRIPPRHFSSDESGQVRPSSAAFEDHPDGSPMSVILADILAATGRNSIEVLVGLTGFALASITVGVVRENGQGVMRDPTPDEPAHALVFGKKTHSIRKKLARSARWVIPPPRVVNH
jgi:hypothetical protein